MGWTVIVAVKRIELAKTRLRSTIAGVDHDGLVLAMALDTVDAALASPVVGRVILVTSDAVVAAGGEAIGAESVPDVPDAGLNPALAYAAAQVRRSATQTPPGVVALAGDLPALRTDELTEALQAASGRARSFVADAEGIGTVLLAAPPGVQLEPCFGADSAVAHAASGAVELSGAWPGLRRDVDTSDDLTRAILLGLGARTRAVGEARTPATVAESMPGGGS